MNYTLINAEYNPDTKISTVTIGTDIGPFTAVSICRKEDLPNESKYFGCQVAEWKALRQYAKAKLQLSKARISSLCSYWRVMSETRNYNIDAYWVKKLRDQIDAETKVKDLWEKRICDINAVIVTSIATRDAGLKAMKKRG